MEEGIQFYTAFLNPREQDPVMEFCREREIPVIDMNVDLDREGFRNIPYDYHPSKLGHQAYAERMIDFFESEWEDTGKE